MVPPRAAPQQPIPPPAPAPIQFATVELLGVTMGLSKPDGSPWDFDLGSAPKRSDLEDISHALGLPDPVGAVLDILGRPTVHATAKPDVGGKATILLGPNAGTSFKLGKTQDSFTPVWSGARWSGVELDGSMRVRVALVDLDALNDNDPIPAFEITAQDIRAAVAKGKVHQVKVADQTARQVLFAAISAFPER